MNAPIINTRPKKIFGQQKYNSKYILLMCMLFCILIFARALSDVSFYVFAGISLIVFMMSSIGDCVVFLFFLLPFNTILKQNPDGMSFFTILFFLVILRMVIQNQKISLKLLIALAIFFVYAILFSGLEELTTIITMIAGILMLYYIRKDDISIDINLTVIVYSLAICLASVLALCKGSLPIINVFINDSIMKLGENEYATRFSGLHGNPNYYTLEIVVALSAIIVLMYYKEKTLKTHIVCFVALSIFGIMSVSKSFLLTWILLMLCWFILSIKKGYKKVFSYIFVVAIGIMIAYYFAYDYINAYLLRLTADSSSSLDSITTGRTEIWIAYLEVIFNDIKILLFGNGLRTLLQPLGKGTHSTYLDFLFNLGIVGSVILVVAIRFGIGQIKIKGVVWIPVIMLMIRMLAIGVLTYDNLWFYLAILQMLAYDHQKKAKFKVYGGDKKLSIKKDLNI